MEENRQRQIYQSFSNWLDYPTSNLVEQIRTGIDLLKENHPQAAEKMADFLSFVENTPSGRLEEVYTGTFDINPACHIFAGHIMFGESFKRGSFMAGLEENYQNHNFDKGKELADHIPVILKFLSTLELNETFAKDLIIDCLIPVFQKMNANFGDNSENPYVPVLRSVLLILEGAIAEGC